MSNTNLYYLMARDRNNDDLSVIKINGKRGVSLEDIDIFTTDFKDSEELNKKLIEDGILTSDNNDFFITFQRKFRGETILKKYELLYSDNDYIKEIAENSNKNKIVKSEDKVDRILDYFAHQVQKKPALYDLLVTGKTNVYEKYAKYFAYTNYNLASSIKYLDGGWARQSYPLIRNVLDALNHVERKYDLTSDQFHRSLLDNTIIRITDKNYDENQLTFLEFLPTEEDFNKLISKAMNTFESLPRKVFATTSEGIHINSSMFLDSDVEDIVLLDKYMPQELKIRIDLFLLHRDYMNNSPYPFSNSYLSSVEMDQKEIEKYLKDHKGIIGKIIKWCDIYESNKDKVLGDNNERGYQKRKEY